jgi:hypothetical protein
MGVEWRIGFILSGDFGSWGGFSYFLVTDEPEPAGFFDGLGAAAGVEFFEDAGGVCLYGVEGDI